MQTDSKLRRADGKVENPKPCHPVGGEEEKQESLLLLQRPRKDGCQKMLSAPHTTVFHSGTASPPPQKSLRKAGDSVTHWLSV